MCQSLPVVALRPQNSNERELGDPDDDNERRERSEGVRVVDEGEAPTPFEGPAKAQPLDHRRRNCEPEER